MKPRKLNTEKEGRLFAIATFKAARLALSEGIVEAGQNRLEYAADSGGEEQGEFLIHRTTPQSDVLRSAFADLFSRGTQEAINGFFTVWTDYIGATLSGCYPSQPAKHYAAEERAGLIPAWGSITYTHPKAAKAAIAKGESTYTVRR